MPAGTNSDINDSKQDFAESKNGSAIVWFRDDLRVADHPALYHAGRNFDEVACIYILDEQSDGIRAMGAAQKWFLHHSLANLSNSLNEIGLSLHIFRGKAQEILSRIAAELNSNGVFWNRRYGKAEIEIDKNIKSYFATKGLEAKSFQGNLLHEPVHLKTGSGGPYRVYSPFWKALLALGTPRRPLSAPTKGKSPHSIGGSISLNSLKMLPENPNWASKWLDQWAPSEQGAEDRLDDFLSNGIKGYSEGRDFPDSDNVSRLSPFLRFGLISPFQIWSLVSHREQSNSIPSKDAEKFLKELAWREFSYHLLYHYPDISWKNFNEKFDEFPWHENQPQDLEAWQQGKTGYPLVDAGMRELWQTGYMHNRVRMVVGSFLVKHLLIHWRRGEEWFWDTLMDGDPANNSASWQWIAGCGADAAPYFRVFNPILQSSKFDLEGNYIRRYIPELAKLPNKYLHTPWEAPTDVLEKAGVTLGEHYPMPIIDHDLARKRALAAFSDLKRDEE